MLGFEFIWDYVYWVWDYWIFGLIYVFFRYSFVVVFSRFVGRGVVGRAEAGSSVCLRDFFRGFCSFVYFYYFVSFRF